MKKYIIHLIVLFSSLFIYEEMLFSATVIEKVNVPSQQTNYPFSTDSTHFTRWNGHRYVPFYIKGINLGVSVPGTFPGEMAATRAQYWQWFAEIKDAGYNMIRLYTLHYPRFYEVLDSFNVQHPDNPIYFMQGVWLEEELPGYNQDLFYISSAFKTEIEEDIDCVHGNRTIGFRFGKAYGTYTKDASKWLMGYLIGREVSNWEVQTTNAAHLDKTAYSGTYLSISNVHAAEVFVTQKLDSLLIYEQTNYNTQHPVAFSSWPTLDPLTHPSETHTDEDTEKLELAEMDFSNAKAGFFVSYHAYPYYPDFISRDIPYQNYSDEYGQNMYLGYLLDLKAHYPRMPLLIAEFGVPSSWAVAHYSRSGMNHGGNTELEQGIVNHRMLKTFESANLAGGIQFAWIDEWFKRTWITDPIDYNVDERVMWHNVAAAEQNFGLVGYRKNNIDWQTLGKYTGTEPIDSIQAAQDHAYFNIKLHTKQQFANLDTLWIAIDTYDATLGEKKLVTGQTLTNGAEFLLRITNDAADLFVTQAYDLYGIWHGISPVEQKFQSTLTNGAPWHLVRWKNNSGDQDIQYVGHLKVNRLHLPESSMDGVRMDGDSIEVRIPWSYINFISPAHMKVMHDNRSTAGTTETRISDGIALAVLYKDSLLQSPTRLTWTAWNNFNDVVEYKKDSYYYMQENMPLLPGFFVAVADNYKVAKNANAVLSDVSIGLLANDILLEAGTKEAVLIDPPSNGFIQIEANGTFTYIPDSDYLGADLFTYKVFGDYHRTDTASVQIEVVQSTSPYESESKLKLQVYPNPADDRIFVKSSSKIDVISFVTADGVIVLRESFGKKDVEMDISSLPEGVYIVYVRIGTDTLAKKVVVK